MFLIRRPSSAINSKTSSSDETAKEVAKDAVTDEQPRPKYTHPGCKVGKKKPKKATTTKAGVVDASKKENEEVVRKNNLKDMMMLRRTLPEQHPGPMVVGGGAGPGGMGGGGGEPFYNNPHAPPPHHHHHHPPLYSNIHHPHHHQPQHPPFFQQPMPAAAPPHFVNSNSFQYHTPPSSPPQSLPPPPLDIGTPEPAVSSSIGGPVQQRRVSQQQPTPSTIASTPPTPAVAAETTSAAATSAGLLNQHPAMQPSIPAKFQKKQQRRQSNGETPQQPQLQEGDLPDSVVVPTCNPITVNHHPLSANATRRGTLIPYNNHSNGIVMDSQRRASHHGPYPMRTNLSTMTGQHQQPRPQSPKSVFGPHGGVVVAHPMQQQQRPQSPKRLFGPTQDANMDPLMGQQHQPRPLSPKQVLLGDPRRAHPSMGQRPQSPKQMMLGPQDVALRRQSDTLELQKRQNQRMMINHPGSNMRHTFHSGVQQPHGFARPGQQQQQPYQMQRVPVHHPAAQQQYASFVPQCLGQGNCCCHANVPIGGGQQQQQQQQVPFTGAPPSPTQSLATTRRFVPMNQNRASFVSPGPHRNVHGPPPNSNGGPLYCQPLPGGTSQQYAPQQYLHPVYARNGPMVHGAPGRMVAPPTGQRPMIVAHPENNPVSHDADGPPNMMTRRPSGKDGIRVFPAGQRPQRRTSVGGGNVPQALVHRVDADNQSVVTMNARPLGGAQQQLGPRAHHENPSVRHNIPQNGQPRGVVARHHSDRDGIRVIAGQGQHQQLRRNSIGTSTPGFHQAHTQHPYPRGGAPPPASSSVDEPSRPRATEPLPTAESRPPSNTDLNDGIRVRPVESSPPKSPKTTNIQQPRSDGDGIRVHPGNDGIRVHSGNDGIRVHSGGDDGIRVRPSSGGDNDGIRVKSSAATDLDAKVPSSGGANSNRNEPPAKTPEIVPPTKTYVGDDGIRVRAGDENDGGATNKSGGLFQRMNFGKRKTGRV